MGTKSQSASHILIVDDEESIRESLADILELQGFRVLVARDGLEALNLIEQQVPDLILADIMMPRMNGYQLFQRVRDQREFDYIPFLFLSAKNEQEDIRFGKELGIDDYLRKPIDTQDLLAAIRGKLRRYERLKPAASDPSSMVQPGAPLKANHPDYGLTRREFEVLHEMVKGNSNHDIAQTLFIATSTVKSHVSSILTKLGVENRVEAVTKAIAESLLSQDKQD